MIMEEAHERSKLIEDVRKVFMKADSDKSGALDWEEFERHVGDPRVQAYFRQLDLDIETSGTRGLFTLLDFDGNGVVDADEFIYGCARLKGHARSVDLARISHNVRFHGDTLMKLEGLYKKMQGHLVDITKQLNRISILST